MNSDKVNQWLTLAANIGVLAGIFFLAMEISQNSELARLQFSEDRQALWQHGEISVFGDSIASVWEKSVLEPECLSLAETRMLDAYLAFQLSNTVRVRRLEEAGLLEAGATQTHAQDTLPFFFDTEFARTWWEIEGRTWDPEVVRIVEPIVQATPKNQSVNKLMKIRRDTAARINTSE